MRMAHIIHPLRRFHAVYSCACSCAQGHLPKAMDAFGTSSWRATSPDVARETDALYSA
jgi:hypothetical protein